LFPCEGRCPLENLRIVVIQPFDSMIPIKRLDPRAHPPAKVAMAVGVNFNPIALHDSYIETIQ
jgi:hypothetical protein